MRIWIILIILITACSPDSSGTKSENLKLPNCKQTKVEIAKNSEWVDSVIYLSPVFKDDSTKFVWCNNKVSDPSELADHILIWNSRPVSRFQDRFKFSCTRTVLSSDSIRQIDFFAMFGKERLVELGFRLMLNKNSKKIYINNNYLLSNKFITLDEWCKLDDLPRRPE